jgi:glyoxalase family protein
LAGIHHITAISGRAYRNLGFYTGTLGMRLVKQTVNFDDPGTYHLYYGDEVGHLGTILTFFAWEDAPEGRSGVGLTHQTAFRVPAGSLGYWTHRFIEKNVPHEALETRFGVRVLAFTDPDGMRLALVGVADVGAEKAWSNADVPSAHHGSSEINTECPHQGDMSSSPFIAHSSATAAPSRRPSTLRDNS